METEQSTQAPTSYETPTGIEDFTSEEAASTLKGIYAASISPSHPLHHSQGQHFQHKIFTDLTTKLHEIKCAPEVEAQEDKLAIEADEYKASKQALLVKEATVLVDDLVENHNFEPRPIPPDIQEWQIRCWRIQKNLAQENYAEVASSIQKELRILNADSETINSVSESRADGDFPAKYRDKFLRSLIDDILKVHRRRAAEPRTDFGEPLQSFGGVES